ncbi:hypothetical protein JCM8097_005698 [Rhodosporidiobolus ruineniae]
MSTRAQTPRTAPRLDALPDDLLLRIFSFIAWRDYPSRRQTALARLCRISKAVYRVASAALWTDVVYPGDRKSEDALLVATSRPDLAAHTRTVNLNGKPTEALAATLTRYRNLEHVLIGNDLGGYGQVVEGDFDQLGRLAKLESLNFSWIHITSSPDHAAFSSLTTLVLNSVRSRICDVEILLLPRFFPALRYLSLNHITDPEFGYVFPDLEPALLSQLSVLQLRLDDLNSRIMDAHILPFLFASPAPLLITICRFNLEACEQLEDAAEAKLPIRHLCITGLDEGLPLDEGHIADRGSLATTFAVLAELLDAHSAFPTLETLWLSPRCAEVSTAQQDLAELVRVCEGKKVAVKWLRPVLYRREDEPYGAVFDEGVRRYFDGLKAASTPAE